MVSKGKAAIIIIILIVGGAAAAYFYLTRPSEPTPYSTVDTPSSFNGDLWISEIHMNTSLTVDEEYFELYISGSATSTLTGLRITTFDDEGLIELPSFTGIDTEDYLAIYSGTGTNDVDASDGNAEIYLDLEERILDPTGDEIGIFDDAGEVIDFLKYSGGNGDEVYDNWDSNDDGPSLPSGHTGSLSFFGNQYTNSSNWLESLLTPGFPNQYSFLSESEEYHVTITSGVTEDFSFEGIDDITVAGKNETVDVTAGPGVDAATIKQIEENIKFSLGFYEGKGFSNGPATSTAGKVKVTVKNGTSTETTGATSQNGDIVINVGTVKSKIDLKYVCEHELMHAFQFKQTNEGGDTVDHAPMTNKWWVEGQATYWGIESTKANFNINDSVIQDEFDRVGDHNWNDHYTDLNRSIFIGWGGSYDDYMGSYLFMKFIKEKYGEDKLKDAFDKAKDNFNNDSKDKSPEDAVAEACGKTWDQLVAEFYAWMMTDAISDNGVPERVGHVNVTYTNDTVSDSLKVGPYASGVERIKVNGTQPFQIDIQTPPGSQWKITIIYVYEDGSREQGFNTPYTISGTSAPWPVNPGAHGKKLVEIIVIKTLVQTGTPVTVNMTVSPIENSLWNLPYLLTPGIMEGWQLPPLFHNYTDPLDWPWSSWWWFTYDDNIYQESIVIDPDEFMVDSFFDVYVTIHRVPVVEYVNVSAVTPIVIDWDPTWIYGDYLIEIRQSTWGSWVNGTIIWNHNPRPGSSWNIPDHIDVGEVRAADSNEWDADSHWYHVMIDDAMEYLFQIYLDAPFIGTGNWTIELYNTTHSDVILRTTEGYYYTDEWPRYLVLPSLGDHDYSDMHEYIIRLVYLGGGSGNSSFLSQPYEGATIDNPLWHTILTEEYFGIDLPYTYTGTGWVYVNATVSSLVAYHVSFNATTQFVYAEVWYGSTWLQIPFNSYDGIAYWYSISFQALADTISMRFLAEMGEPHIYHILSELT